VLQDDQGEVDVQISLVYLIHDDVSVLLNRSWVVHKTLEENTRGHEQNFSLWTRFGLHSNVVADLIANSVLKLERNSLCDIGSSQPSGLSTDDVNFLIVEVSMLENVLGHLSGLSTARVA